MAETNKDSMHWTVQHIPKNDTRLALYLEHYKPFRLLALECDPAGECPYVQWQGAPLKHHC